MADDIVDVVIVGGGPGGLTAGIYAIRRALSVVLLEMGKPGGQMLFAKNLENYPGFERISGVELAEKMRKQAEKLGVAIVDAEVVSMDLRGKTKKVKTKEKEYLARSVVIATGSEYRKLGAKGEKEFSGRGVSYCATCDAPFFKGRRVAVVGGGNKAVSDALFLADVAKEVYLIHRRDSLRAEEVNQRKLSEKGVKILYNSMVEEFSGKAMLSSVSLKNTATGETTQIEVDGAFISIGTIPHTEVAKESGVKLDASGFIIVDRNQMTNIPGVFSVGDATGGVMQISTAVGSGCVAALSAYKYVKEPYWKN